MLIARSTRVRHLVTIAVGELAIFNQHMIGKKSVSQITKEMTVGDKVELTNVMTRS